MAVAGLHNVSVFDSSFLRESGPPESRQWGEQDRTGTRASSLLQLWRELEGEHVVNHSNARTGERSQQQRNDRSNPDSESTFRLDGGESVNGNDNLELNDVQNESSGICSRSHVGSENEQEDCNSVTSEQSADLGEVERQRVRQIFREWMNNGAKNHSANVPHRNSHSPRSQQLHDNERSRGGVVVDPVRANGQHKGNRGSSTDEAASETGSQIDVLDGSLGNHCEIGERRTIRKLCGRQALLDLLAKAQRERKKELQELLERKRVSNFSHRNRIQALLRGRFLRNEVVAHDERPTSRARSELGFLRQRHAVSNLREGFLSRLDSIHGSQNSSVSDTSSNPDHDVQRNDQFLADDEQELPDDICGLFEPSDEEREGNGFPVGSNKLSDLIEEQIHHASTSQAAGDHRVNGVSQSMRDSNADACAEETSELEVGAEGHLEDVPEIIQEQDAPIIEASPVHEVDDGRVEDPEVRVTEDLDRQETGAHAEEWQESAPDHEEGGWQQLSNVVSGNEESLSGTWQEGGDNHQNQERLNNDSGEQPRAQEPQDDWHRNDLQEAIDSWLDVPSGEDVGSIGRVDTFYFPDDDNVYSMELRELLSRRRVSSLLRSGFRASLDQLIQSYVERQGNASLDWEAEETTSPPAFTEPDQDQQHGDQENDGDHSGGIDTNTSSVRDSHPLWDQELAGVDWAHQSQPRLGIEWEIISELRIDLVRLQQRMNNMQRMLEACMDMQLELQRSVRQEVSAALNRGSGSEDASKDHGPTDKAKWDCVRKGICCICREHSINSLLYRCGHMCTCTSCAEKLLQGNEKCPMCQAPIVEVIRAYSTQS